MLQIDRAARAVLVGREGSLASRVACSHPAILSLAIVAVALHALDLVTGIRMMDLYGLAPEQNPLARALFHATGAMGLSIVKSAVVGGGVTALVYLARRGRPRLARNALLLVAILGLLGFSSNLI